MSDPLDVLERELARVKEVPSRARRELARSLEMETRRRTPADTGALRESLQGQVRGEEVHVTSDLPYARRRAVVPDDGTVDRLVEDTVGRLVKE